MSDIPRISIRLDGSMSPRQCVELATEADKAGLSGVWFAENAFARGIWPAAAACAVATRRIHIHAGVFNPFNRHPTMMAMEIGAFDELANGRASISIGAGIISASAKLSIDAEKPVPALRDALVILRGLLNGEEVNYVGQRFSAKKVRLDCKPLRDIPIFLAGRGDMTIKLAGAAADGLLVSNMCSAGYAGRSAELMRSARSQATGGRVVQYMPCIVNSSSLVALRDAKRIVGEMVPRFWTLGQKVPSAKEALLLGTTIEENEFAEAADRINRGQDPADVLDERYTTAFSIYGTAEECLLLAGRYKSAGVDELGLTFMGNSAPDAIRAIGQAVAAAN
ncbi:LLM class flavin-dependent oxidoreductase [Bradyrhizobium sp. NP1]|uniref:LLM class flavin-dependent oxidoreductase n=1 Tax=Bradyrhizobium sp. NP1 TaxID=3049772 RepID=UPI0025A51429|nr:LLM class flavin-dependent oxidoreductase [Bradyrhizobium sp. NP1]WJR80332.1 LLM class flavin-dependent oxidoreductase [Bradyrhizobium sp. NP1]